MSGSSLLEKKTGCHLIVRNHLFGMYAGDIDGNGIINLSDYRFYKILGVQMVINMAISILMELIMRKRLS